MSISESSLFVTGRKGGRPKVAEARHVPTTIHLTEREYASVYQHAKRTGLTISSTLRTLALARLKTDR